MMTMRSELVHEFAREAAEVFGVHPRDVLSRVRSPSLAHARFLAFAFARHRTLWSSVEIGRFFGLECAPTYKPFDHTTVLNGFAWADEHMWDRSRWIAPRPVASALPEIELPALGAAS